MRKTINLALNKYVPVPHSLREDPSKDLPISQMQVDPARLFHHYYLDTRGYAPPNPDPAQFEHLALFLPCDELRVRGDGFGIGTAFRRSTSNQLGQAFCRWFLHEHLNITYFAHLEAVLNRKAHPHFGGHTVSRIGKGDAPDYLCAEHSSTVYLAEAKGRTTSISFGSADFKKWRSQFSRVAVKDKHDTLCSVKGHIVAARFATEADGDRIKSRLLAEDPASPGDVPLREAPGLGSAVIALHYSDIAAKIRQPILSTALTLGVTVPAEIQFPGRGLGICRTSPPRKAICKGLFPQSRWRRSSANKTRGWSDSLLRYKSITPRRVCWDILWIGREHIQARLCNRPRGRSTGISA